MSGGTSGKFRSSNLPSSKSLSFEVDPDRGVSQKVYLSWVKGQLDNESACLELPFTIVLFISFSLLAYLHLNQQNVHSVEQAIERDIIENANFAFSHAFGHKSIMDVHCFADFWSWVRLGFIPLVVQPSWGYSESYGDDQPSLLGSSAATQGNWTFGAFGAEQSRTIPVTGDYLHYNRIIGGLRFRQLIAPMSEDSCKFPSGSSDWSQWYGKPCAPATQELAFMPDSPSAEDFGDAHRVEWMFTDLDSLDTMIAQVVDMEDGCQQMTQKQHDVCLCRWCSQQDPPSPWLTEQTQRVEIGMATFNSEYGLITFTGVNFFFNRGSFIHKRVEVMSSWIDPFAQPLNQLIPMAFFDFVWLSMLFYITQAELREIAKIIRVGEGRWYKSLKEDYIAFWNMVDWISISVALVVVIFYGLLIHHTWQLHGALETLVGARNQGSGQFSREAYARLVIDFYAVLESVNYQEKLFRFVLCIYPMMVMLRLFKSFAAQPRLAVVTETLKEASNDMGHFFIVFLAVLCCLCLNSVLLFGQDIEEYATFPRALHSCFRMMLGDWDWHPMERVRRTAAMMWFTIFMMLIVVILFNMLLAIIMDNYMKVKKASTNAISLAKQTKEMWRRYRMSKSKERVRLDDIWEAFFRIEGNEKAMQASERVINSQYLLDNVEDIPVTQAKRTLKNAYETHIKASETPFELVDSCEFLERLEDNTRHVRNALFRACERVDYYDTLPRQKAQSAANVDSVMADAVALDAEQRAKDSAFSEEVLNCVSTEVGRLSFETASVLAQTVKRVDRRQEHLERRQSDMLAAIREMHQTLLNLQSEASALAGRLQRLDFEQNGPAGGQASQWRRQGLRVVPDCLDCRADASESFMPGLRRSRMSLPSG